MAAIKYWDGEGADGQWTTAINWSDNQLPSATDTVIFDNSLLPGPYTVQLPAGNISVTIAMLKIQPVAEGSILFHIPSLDIAIPAVSVTGSVAIERGGILKNSSGAASGTAISISDSLYLFNGGRYTHNTDNGHASIINRLATSPGTENGTVEFDVPGTAGYSLSFSNRIYGNLMLNATASGGTRSYLSTGSNPLLIRGTFSLQPGTNLSLNFSGEVSVLGKTVIQGLFNISTGTSSNAVKLKGAVDISGIITETGTGQPLVELAASVRQQLSVTGSINNSVTIRINNSAGVELTNPLDVNYKMQLLSGKLIASGANVLTIRPAAVLNADSIRADVFVEGTIRKLGLAGETGFLFPVGAGTQQRWLNLKNAVGDYTVSFHKQSAYSLSSQLDDSLDHVSRMEYWSVEAAAGEHCQVELSFDNVNSGGVTDLAYLRIAWLPSSQWINTGVTSYTGSAGASGSVTSTDVTFSGNGLSYFSLASSSDQLNPLPIEILQFQTQVNGGYTCWQWNTNGPDSLKELSVWQSGDGIHFEYLKTLDPLSKGNSRDRLNKTGRWFFVLQAHWKSGRITRSATAQVNYPSDRIYLKAKSTLVTNFFPFSIRVPKPGKWTFYLLDMQGKMIRKYLFFIDTGEVPVHLPLDALGRGQYQIFGVSSDLRSEPLRFLKF